MTIRRSRSPALAAAVVAAFVAPSLAAQQQASGPSVVVEGTASVELAPDFADVTLEITAEASTPGQATSGVSAQLDALDDALEAFDIRADSVTAVNVARDAPSDDAAGGAAYTASTSLLLRVSEPEQVPMLIRTALRSGASGVARLQFGLEERDEAGEVVLGQAFEEARREAERIAADDGLRLGLSQLVAIRRQGGPFDVRADATSPSINLLSVRPEDIVLRAEVTVRWQLLP